MWKFVQKITLIALLTEAFFCKAWAQPSTSVIHPNCASTYANLSRHQPHPTLKKNLQNLSSRWNQDSIFLEDVVLRSANRVEVPVVSRDVLILSTRRFQNDSAQLNALVEDLTKSLSHGIISPLHGRSRDHMFLRIDDELLDYGGLHGITSPFVVGKYAASKSLRAEMLIQLSDDEMKNFKTYAKNIQANPQKVLGTRHTDPFSDEALTVHSTKTQGRLEDNRLVNQNEFHNCTSWIMTAPVGEKGEKLFELLGASGENLTRFRVHSNYLKTQDFIAFNTSQERVPAILIWTQDDPAELKNQLLTDPTFLSREIFPWKIKENE